MFYVAKELKKSLLAKDISLNREGKSLQMPYFLRKILIFADENI